MKKCTPSQWQVTRRDASNIELDELLRSQFEAEIDFKIAKTRRRRRCYIQRYGYSTRDVDMDRDMV